MITITETDFIDIPDMPEVHRDERRIIYETTTTTNDKPRRTTRIVITQDNAVLGNHYHDFDEQFSGEGKAVLYTAPKNYPTNVTAQELPEGGWKLTIPAGTVHAFRYKKGAVVISLANQHFEDGINTHSVIIKK